MSTAVCLGEILWAPRLCRATWWIAFASAGAREAVHIYRDTRHSANSLGASLSRPPTFVSAARRLDDQAASTSHLVELLGILRVSSGCTEEMQHYMILRLYLPYKWVPGGNKIVIYKCYKL